jgi:hypothetical protein
VVVVAATSGARALYSATVALAGALALFAVPTAAQEHPWTVSSDSLLYTDTDNVLVVSSKLSAARALDEQGGEASADVVVDVVSAASVDVVAQASQRFSELRWEVNLAGSYAISDGLPSVNYRGSAEPDYVSHGFGAGYLARLGGADTVASAHYQITLDTVGRSGTPFDTWSRQLTVHSAELSLTQNLSTHSVLRGVLSLTVERGYQEKPYRFVPLFDAAAIARVEADGMELGLGNFDRYRLATRPPEEVPELRVRPALGARWLYYVEPIESSLRADYRFYLDDWGLLANTVELEIEHPLGELWTLAMTTRGYTQTKASFYRSAYVVERPDEIPGFRTVDRKLAPYDSLSAGARLELHTDAIIAYFEATASYWRFHQYIYLDHLIALIGQGGVAWSF